MCSPLDLAIKKKMVICYIPPRRSWHYILVPPMELMHVRSGSQKSKLFCRSTPILMQYYLARHKIRAQVVNARVTKMVTSLQKQLDVTEGELLLMPTDLNFLKSHMEVDNKLKLAKFELTDVVEVKTTSDESMAFNNAWQTYCERADCLVRSRGKLYSLVLGQFTTVLLNKMKQDAKWQAVSDSYDPLKLLKLIEKFIIKQSGNQ